MIPALGARGAASLQRKLAHRTLLVALATGAEVELWCAPDTGHGFFRACRREFGVRLRRQPRGDLGRRMALALARGPALLVGTDCPNWTPAGLKSAWDALAAGTDCVLQPSADGGYVLIGARKFERRTLAGIAWSSGRELDQTRRRFARLDLRWRELPARADVDTPADYRRARRTGLI